MEIKGNLKKLCIALLGLDKAFDRVTREVTRWTLKKQSVEESFVFLHESQTICCLCNGPAEVSPTAVANNVDLDIGNVLLLEKGRYIFVT